MIGLVTPNLRPVIKLTARGKAGGSVEIDAWVDTGFDGDLMVSAELLSMLEVSAPLQTMAWLADGSLMESSSFAVNVDWNGRERMVQAIETQGHILVGIGLLQHHELRIAFLDGGEVTIEAID
jgi:clan AA aspartic protease